MPTFNQARTLFGRFGQAGRNEAYVTDTVPAGEWQRLAATLYASELGYLEVKLIDESLVPVYFNDLLLKTSKEREIQENHYDTWGLNLVGIES